MTLLAVVLGAGAGAVARYLTDLALQTRYGRAWPWGTLVVNVLGSFLLGAVVGVAGQRALPEPLVTGLAVGVCGALTTYSTFGYDTFTMLHGNRWAAAAVNVLTNVGGGALALAAGLALGAAGGAPAG